MRDRVLKTLINDRIIFFLALITSIIAAYFSYTLNLMTAYNDATAHLNTARRMIDSLTPGFVQIGSVWLPLLHLLELPFVAFDVLYFTGFAGAIVSGMSFVISAVFLYKLIIQITKSRVGGLIGVLLFLSNANLLYLQTTAMFEPLLMATVFGSVYYLSKWTQTQTVNHLVIAAFLTCLATLTRYDGWAYFIASSIYVMFVSFIQKRKNKEGSIIIYILLAGFGIAIWLFYNHMIFNNALFFANSEYSAKAQQDILEERGALPTKHDLPLSFITYSIAVIINLGALSTFGLVLGLIAFLIFQLRHPKTWGPLLLLIPYFFNIISLYLGQSVIWVPMLAPYFDTYFNARYGLLMLPAAAFFLGYFASKHKAFVVIALFLIIGQAYLFFNPKIIPIFGHQVGIITLQDTVSSINKQTMDTSNFIHTNYDDGLILVSSASVDSLIFRSGLPLKKFITEGTGNYWTESLQDPTRHARWVVFFRDRTDRVGRQQKNWKNFDKQYELKYEDQTYLVYKKVSE